MRELNWKILNGCLTCYWNVAISAIADVLDRQLKILILIIAKSFNYLFKWDWGLSQEGKYTVPNGRWRISIEIKALSIIVWIL